MFENTEILGRFPAFDLENFPWNVTQLLSNT